MNALARQLLQTLRDSVNLQAFLRVIRDGESAQEETAYRWLFGSTRTKPKLFDSFADHPRVRTYEAYDGQFIKNGKIDFTTAAGAYQITQTTWGDCVNALALDDFSPVMQDVAAVWLIRRGKALEDVLAGRVRQAIAKLGNEWASLPSATYGQPTKTLARALQVYREWGGTERPDGAPAPIETRTIPPEEKPVAIPAALTGLAGILINAFTPLAAEKIQKELRRHTDDSKAAEQITTAVIDAAKVATGLQEPLQAVAAAQANPAVLQSVEQAALGRLSELAPILDKLAELEDAQHRRTEDSRDRAEARARSSLVDQDPYLTKSIIQMMVGMMAGGALLAALLSYLKVDAQAIIGALLLAAGAVVGEFKTRYQHRYGSSSGSASKDALLDDLARRK